MTQISFVNFSFLAIPLPAFPHSLHFCTTATAAVAAAVILSPPSPVAFCHTLSSIPFLMRRIFANNVHAVAHRSPVLARIASTTECCVLLLLICDNGWLPLLPSPVCGLSVHRLNFNTT